MKRILSTWILLNCYRNKELLWKIGIKDQPLCYLCDDEFENLYHLFGSRKKTTQQLNSIGVYSICDIKSKIAVQIAAGSWNEEKQKIMHWIMRLLKNLPLYRL